MRSSLSQYSLAKNGLCGIISCCAVGARTRNGDTRHQKRPPLINKSTSPPTSTTTQPPWPTQVLQGINPGHPVITATVLQQGQTIPVPLGYGRHNWIYKSDLSASVSVISGSPSTHSAAEAIIAILGLEQVWKGSKLPVTEHIGERGVWSGLIDRSTSNLVDMAGREIHFMIGVNPF